jgi:hypothetical protein
MFEENYDGQTRQGQGKRLDSFYGRYGTSELVP